MPRYLFSFPPHVIASVIAPTPEKAVAYLVERLNDNCGSYGYDLELGQDHEARDLQEYVRVDGSLIPTVITKDHIYKVEAEE